MIWKFFSCDGPASAIFVPKRTYAPHYPSELMIRKCFTKNFDFFSTSAGLFSAVRQDQNQSRQFKHEDWIGLKLRLFFNFRGTFLRCPPELNSKADSLRSEADYLLFSLSYKAAWRRANPFFIPLHLPFEYSYTSSRIFIMKTIFSLVALIALVPALVAAGDGESNDSDDLSGDRHHPHSPRPTPTQVLWGQCTFILSIVY